MAIPPNLILDLDDTILDYSAPAEKIWPRLYAEYASRLDLPVESLSRAVDESRRWYWSDMGRFREGRLDLQRARRTFVRDAFVQLGRGDFEAADEMADAFTWEREIVVRPFDGALAALESFRQSGSCMVLLTNGQSSLQRAKIERFGLAGFFRKILIEGETGIGKPDPRAFRAALESLGADPPQAWMVGDDPEFDIRPAKKLGMHAAWIRNSPGTEENIADCTAPTLRTLAADWAAKKTTAEGCPEADPGGGGTPVQRRIPR